MSASVFMNWRPSRAALRRVAKHQAAIDRATDGDRRYFERRPDRTYRVRLASVAEIEAAGAALDMDMTPVPGGRHVMLVRKLAGDVRLRILAQAHGWMAGDLDLVGEDEAGRAYRYTCRPGTAAFRTEQQAIATLKAAGVLS